MYMNLVNCYQKQGSLYHSVPLGMGGSYQSNKGPVWVVHWYDPMYHVSVCSV